jgi:membrane-bound lytic murein transglycosylase B
MAECIRVKTWPWLNRAPPCGFEHVPTGATLAPMIRRALARPAVFTLVAALAACATQKPPQQPTTSTPAPVAPPAAAPAPTPPAPVPPQLRDISVARAQFVRDTAAKYGIDAATIESALAKASIRDSVIAAMSRPAEAKPWSAYRPIFLTPARIDGGRAFVAANREALAREEARYGVPAEIVTAIIGVETSYGGNKGSYPVIDALYTLAFFYPRSGDPAKLARENQREAFFRDELGQLFALGKETGFDITTLKGSYAGEMGWGQFMPSSYRQYAVDGDGDGRRDLFGNLDDVFASIANYFVQKGGWQRGGPVMVPATRDGAADYNAESIDAMEPLSAFAARGFRTDQPIAPDAPANLIRLDGAAGPEYWLVFNNFRAITKYNTSRLYATAVYQLAEAIAGREVGAPPAVPATAPAVEIPAT